MAHPKRKTSKQRRDKRRTHVKASIPDVQICKETNEPHLRHHAYLVDGDLYYKGKLFSEGKDL
ncbi:MAG: 50S ribosomal protein L32 [Chitinophagales bacterium]